MGRRKDRRGNGHRLVRQSFVANPRPLRLRRQPPLGQSIQQRRPPGNGLFDALPDPRFKVIRGSVVLRR